MNRLSRFLSAWLVLAAVGCEEKNTSGPIDPGNSDGTVTLLNVQDPSLWTCEIPGSNVTGA